MDKPEPSKIVGPSPALCNAATQSPRKPLATVFFCSDRGCRVSEWEVDRLAVIEVKVYE